MSTGAQLVVDQFAEIVRPDGGELRLVAVEGELLRVAYRPGHNEQCETCVMGPEELGEMLRSAVADHDPSIKRVAVESPS
jgi:hypothetical protein